MTLSEAVNRAIDLARKVHDYYEAELPKYHPNYPLVGPDDAEPPPPPEEKELRDFLAALPEETIYQLMLISHLGRGLVGTKELAGYYHELLGYYGAPGRVASYLVGHATLA